MPFQRGNKFGSGGRRNEAAERNGKRVGPKAKHIRLPLNPDTVWIAVSIESGALAQRTMIGHPDIPTIEALYELAMERLAATTT